MKKPDIKRNEWKLKEVDGNYWLITDLDSGDGFYRMGVISGADHNSLEDTAKAISAVPEMIDALIKVREAYQGVGDFEGTGQNLMKLIPEIDVALEKAGVKK